MNQISLPIEEEPILLESGIPEDKRMTLETEKIEVKKEGKTVEIRKSNLS